MRDGAVVVRGASDRRLSYGQVIATFYGGRYVLGKGVVNTKPLYDTMNAETGQSSRPSIFWMYAAIGIEAEVDPARDKISAHQDGVRRGCGQGDQPARLNRADRRRRHHGPRHGNDGGGRLRRRPHAEPDVPRLQDADHTRRAAHGRSHRRERARRGTIRRQGNGESAIAPVPAALGNAVYDAVGVQVKDLPIRAEKVYRALQASGQ